jgi:hypothetical protein
MRTSRSVRRDWTCNELSSMGDIQLENCEKSWI